MIFANWEFNEDLLWSSDWNGYEVGHENINVVGLYKLKNTETYFYIDIEKQEIIEYFSMLDNED